MFRIVRDTTDNSDFLALITLLDEDLFKRYGDWQKQYVPFNRVDHLDAIIAYENEIPVGCGCFKIYANDSVELKRMFVLPDYRGTGVAMLIISELEKWALEKSYSKAVLETGIYQPEAIRFYEKAGYRIIDNYGQYMDIKTSICMAKNL